MDKQIKNKAKRIFTAMLALTVMSATLPYTPLSGVFENVAITANAVDAATYFDASTHTLTLKGTVLRDNDGIILPNGVSKENVLHIKVDDSGATLPRDSSSLFKNFTSVTSIDLTRADTSKVTDMTQMFCRCKNLTAIYVSDQWKTGSVTESNHMFNNCSKLTGGNGTTYSFSNINAEYARIDKEGQPGYLTGVYSLTPQIMIWRSRQTQAQIIRSE